MRDWLDTMPAGYRRRYPAELVCPVCQERWETMARLDCETGTYTYTQPDCDACGAEGEERRC